MAKGIRKLDPHVSFADLFGVKNAKETIHIVRFLVVGKTKYQGKEKEDMVVAVFNCIEIRDGVELSRAPGWGMPGGKVDSSESPCEAIKKHEYGEIPWRILGEPVYLYSTDAKDCGDRIEMTHFFYVTVDEESPGSITPEEAREISTSTTGTGFFNLMEILQQWDCVGINVPRERWGTPEMHQMYYSHKKFFVYCMARYEELKANEEIE